ncbi:MAG: helix-turn-helix transcriptional regulator [Clostridia bacterium]|nr:helix-turn-helix transcriptional regulator [Clostridia bacterium]
MITIKEIQKNLIYELTTIKLNQTKIAKELNITQPTVNCYIKGKALPALDTFANLCVILDLDANEVLGITEERKRQN